MTRLMMCFIGLVLFAQYAAQTKKPINTAAYYQWKSLSSEEISEPGNWITYIEKAYRGNDRLVLLENGTIKKSWDRVSRYHMDPSEGFIVFQQNLDYDSIRQLKIDKVKKKKWPADSVGVYISANDTTIWFEQADKFQTGEKGEIVLIIHDEKFKLPEENKQSKKKQCFLKRKQKENTELKGKGELEGSVLSVFSVSAASIMQFNNVKESEISENGNYYSFVQTYYEDTIVRESLYVGKSDQNQSIFSSEGEISNLTFSDAGHFLAFNVSVDTTKAKKQQLYIYDTHKDSVYRVLDTLSSTFKSYQCVAKESMTFSDDGGKLFFQVGIKPKDDPKDTVPSDELAKLDIWSWTDGKIQPQQLKSAKRDALGLMDYVFDVSSKEVVQLQDTSTQSLKYQKGRSGNYALLTDQAPYLSEMTWDFWYYDVFRVDLTTGEKKELLKHAFGWDYSLSPWGNKFTYWNPEDSAWYLKDLNSGDVFNLTEKIDDKFFASNHDVPSKIGAAGKLHWMINEQSCIIESQHDIWIIPIFPDYENKLHVGRPYRLTQGKEEFESFDLLMFDEDQQYFSLTEGFYLHSFNHKTKKEGIHHFGYDGLEKLGEWDSKILGMKQAEFTGDIMVKKMSFTESYNLFLLNVKDKSLSQVSDINPQQSDYKWGTVELVDWKDYEGDSVSGLLYKPEDFDPNKSYPMIVYFYELYTDDLHFYYRPKPTASIIYPTEYVSNNYIVFIPDIKYEIGHPAKSAYNVIMSGTDAMLRLYPNIDSTRMGLQGQSWGGYQTAQMVTMTTRYKCAMAGAPVSNMFSAYGGVRWGSGLSRTFQYETGQSRIGATIWEKPELYIENSPLFHLPNVETPLLIMHNDGDGAVPWYQGIELYQGLRRLQKPVWMLNYNDDEHNLMKDANRMDLSIRMRAFFDHYLHGEPAPNWLINGVPAIHKGEDSGN